MIQTTKRVGRPIAMRIKKDPLWAYKHGRQAAIDETQFKQFADLFWEEGKKGGLLSAEKVGKLIQRVNKQIKEEGATRHIISSWVSRARGYFIKEHNETIIFVPGKESGYKIAQGAERPLHAGKIGHMALKWKYKFFDSLSILSEKDFQIAGSEIIRRIQKEVGGKIGSLEEREAIFALCKSDLKNLRIEAASEAK